MADSLTPIFRYPGIRSFERNESRQFFGRNKEIAELLNMVKVKSLTVLFSKSGIGKTSLLNAGLSPVLESEGYLPLNIRLQYRTLSPVETVKKLLEPYLNTTLLEKYGGKAPTLWEYIRSCQFVTANGASAQTLVLIFDQFEELFDHHPADQEALAVGLSDLINERLPDTVRERLRNYPRQERNEEVLEWFSPLRVRVVFAIRTDRMGELDRLKRHIPTVLYDRYYLKPMDYEAAREAILRPASMAHLQDASGNALAFETPPFAYTEQAVDTMLQALDNKMGEIESFQLQLLCRHIEEQVQENNVTEVTPLLFGGGLGVQAILNDYYERELSKFDPNEQLIARRFMEEGLINQGRRVGMAEGAEQVQFGVSAELLARLLDSRLIRTEVIHLGKIYELSHDTLVEPVLQSFQQRRQAEERQQAAQTLERERARLRELSKKQRNARMFAIAGFTLAALALTGGLLAWRNAQVAQHARIQADISALAAKAWDVYRNDHTLAFRLAEAAVLLDSTNEDARQTLNGILNIPTTTFYQSVFKDHYFEATAIDFSDDGQLVASGDYEHALYIWNRSNGNVLVNLKEEDNGHTGVVRDVRFMPDGQSVFSAAEDGRLIHFALDNTMLLDTVAHRQAIKTMDLSADGAWVITGSADSTLVLWTTEGRRLCTLRGHKGVVTSVCFSKHKNIAVSGSLDGTVRIWRLPEGQCIRVIQAGQLGVNAVKLSPDEQTIFAGCDDHTARLFRTTGEPLLTIGTHTASVTKVDFSPDGKQLITASNDHTARVWALTGDELLKLVGHNERISSLAISNDGAWIATGSFDFTVKIWNLPFNLDKVQSRHIEPVNKVAVSPDGNILLSGSDDKTAKLWNPDGKLLHNLDGHTGKVQAVSFSADGTRCLTTSVDATICIWDTAGQLLHRFDKTHSTVTDAVFHPALPLIAAACKGDIWLLDTSATPVRTWKAHAAGIKSIRFSPDGQFILTTDTKGLAVISSLEGQVVNSIPCDVYLQCAVFSPDGNSIYTGGRELPIRHWSTDGELLESFFGHIDETYQLAFSPDGSQFASCNWDRTVRIWAVSNKQLHQLAHPDGVYGIVYMPDGKHLVTACRDKLIRIWDVTSGTLTGYVGGIVSPEQIASDGRVARLDNIPFTPSAYGIPLNFVEMWCGNDMVKNINMGGTYLKQAKEHITDSEKGVADFQLAESFFQRAKKAAPADQMEMVDSTLADLYAKRANHYLLNMMPQQYLSEAQKGLAYYPLPVLKAYETLGLLLNGQQEKAMQQYEKLAPQQMGEHEGTYKLFFADEAWYYVQLGYSNEALETMSSAAE